ncbi:MAG TPA: YbdK family carboxylate-amine ligase [Longimicrobiales bacterium]|nr:YbdK family carboxylate-amine ligase [Longimicrobiales bacterium]
MQEDEPPSWGFTLGVEEEYQLIDGVTGALRSCAREVREEDWSAEVRPELQETTVEVGTGVCRNGAELERELRRLRAQVAAGAEARGLSIVAAGVHPFSRWEGHCRTAEERYRQIEERYGRIARDEHNFGMHVHVGVPPSLDRIRLLDVVRWYAPMLLALASSSPIYEGEDTGYASYRMVLWRRWPGTGAPPRLGAESEYRRLVGLLLAAGAITDEWAIYWSVRPHAVYPTLEFRVTDVCPSVDDAVAIGALAQAVVVAAAEGVLAEPVGGGFSEAVVHGLLVDNEWRAMRYGLDAVLVDPGSAEGKVDMRTAICRLLDEVSDVAERLGNGPYLARIGAILERGTAADRIRSVYRRTGRLGPVVRWLAAETVLGTGMDRRRSQRDAAA